MINKKNLEKDAATYAKRVWVYKEDQVACADGFVAGAERMYQQVINSLWHNANEEPEAFRPCLVFVELAKDDIKQLDTYYITHFTTSGWDDKNFPKDYDFSVERWLYMDELLPI